MKRLLFAILAAAAAWAGYWGYQWFASHRAIDAWFDARRADGWVAEYADYAIEGFPNRIDTTFENLTLADPEKGWAWEASKFAIARLSYNPDHLIFVWPDQQRISTPTDKYDLSSADMRASMVFRDGNILRSNLAAQQMRYVDQSGDGLDFGTFQIAIIEEVSGTYRVSLQTDRVTPITQNNVLTAGDLPTFFDTLGADLTIGFDRPWNTRALEQARPQPTALNIANAEAQWGKLRLRLAGKLTFDSDGQTSGKVTIKAENWREIIQIAKQSGQLNDAEAEIVTATVELFASLSGNSKTLDIPIEFSSGLAYIGLLPIGTAPHFQLR